MSDLTKRDTRRKRESDRRRALENKRISDWMERVGIPMNVERVRDIEARVMVSRNAREIFEQAARFADMMEAVQEARHGAANTGGAAAAAKAIRECSLILFGEGKLK